MLHYGRVIGACNCLFCSCSPGISGDSRVADGSKAKGINSNGSTAASERYAIGSGPDPIFAPKTQKSPPSILYCFYNAKPIQIEFQRKHITKMITDMTFKVYNSICIAVVHTYITYHII